MRRASFSEHACRSSSPAAPTACRRVLPRAASRGWLRRRVARLPTKRWPDMSDAIAVLNAGSSSLKFSVFTVREGGQALLARGQVEALSTAPRFVAKDATGVVLAEKSWGQNATLGHAGALDHLVAFLREQFSEHQLGAVGHRVVHGGTEYTRPVRLDASVVAVLEKYIPLAPLHQPHNLAPIKVLLERQPELPQVACFDTAYH